MKPKYQHDCPGCQFLGHLQFEAPQSGPHEVDLYVCGVGNKRTPTLLARASNEVGDYASCSVDVFESAYLGEDRRKGISTLGPALYAAYALWLLKKGGRG